MMAQNVPHGHCHGDVLHCILLQQTAVHCWHTEPSNKTSTRVMSGEQTQDLNCFTVQIFRDLNAVLEIPLKLPMAHVLCFKMLIISGRPDAMNADEVDIKKPLIFGDFNEPGRSRPSAIDSAYRWHQMYSFYLQNVHLPTGVHKDIPPCEGACHQC